MHRYSIAFPISAAFLAGVLAGCATNNEASHHGHRAGAPASMKDMQAMCDMHRQMMSEKTPAQRQAMMDDHMKRPEMREHIQMMQEHCK